MSKLLLSIGIFFCIHSLHAQTFNGTGGAIPDGGAQTCFNITVTGVGAINGTYGLASVCLNITHTYDADLEIYLRAPDGTLVPLSLQNGVAGVNYTNTCFTSTAATSITMGIPPYTGNFKPEGNLGFVNNGQNANGTWSLCIQDLATPDAGNLVNWSLLFNNTPAAPPIIPTNDNPCNAIPLAVNSSCNYSIYTNENAGNTTGIPAPGCASYSGNDVWFSATVPAGGALIFDTQEGTMTDGGMAIYSGTCGAMALIACDDDASNNGDMPMISATGLTPGSTVWIRVWSYGADNDGTFGICVTTPPPPPTNDEPCNAFSLPVNTTCNFSYYTNVGATASSVPNPGCGNYQGTDVWFTVTVPPGGAIIFDSNTGTMTDGDMAVYSGTCSALTLLACDDLSSVNGLMPSITLTGLTPGATLWVRFWGYGANNTGSFQLCASIPPPPTAQDCPAALAICQNIYHEGTSYSGTGSIPNEINAATSCLSGGERADVWYTFTVTTSGNLNFTITPNVSTDDYDWAVYNLTNAPCSAIYNNPALNVSCNFSATTGNTGPTGASASTNQGALGTPFNAQIPVVAGQTYVINVSNYTLSSNGYTIDFGASTASIFDNVAPHLLSVSASTLCGGTQVNTNFSENILCSTIQNADFTVTGPGGPYSVTGWSSSSCTAGATYANNVVLTVSPAMSTNGSYQVCLTNASGSVTDLCGNVAPPNCLSFTVATTIPTFNPVPSICSGSAAPVLPTTSTNGITGTWSPATVSNTATGTYTFTPGTGQCATTATLTVTVTSGIAGPTVTSPVSYCQGATASPLSATGSSLLWYTTPTGGVGSATAPTPSTTTAGTITYYVTQTSGSCESPRIPIVVNVTSLPVIYVHGTNPTCASICDGTATADITGGTPPYTYTWSNSGNTQTITGLCVGTYSVTVTDANTCAASTSPVVAPGCFQIQSVLVDACSAIEYDQEMVFFQVGQNPLNTAAINVTWPTAANTWNGLCTDPAFIASVNATITGGGSLLPLPASGILPANANVVLITSTPATSASSFANLTGPVYALFQCAGNTQGHFANNTGAAGPRTLVMNFGAGCTDTTTYNTNQLINTGGTTGGSVAVNNGAYVNYSFDGTPTYLNYGCTIPTTIQSSQVTLTAPAAVTPTFNPVASVCQNATAPVLPTSSTNATPITGTWSPAVSTSTTGTTVYTFTPTGGQCATTTTLSITVTAPIVPTFNPVASVCQNAAAPVLPTSSTNATPITGTWSPAVSTATTGTTVYTFTPTGGQCATTTTLSITVTAPIVPTFNPVASVCQNAAAPVLPTSSTNATPITGTWSPAVSTATTGTTVYTFTPTAGQCATTTTLSITVTAPIVPTFNPVASVCQNAAAPVLPTSSTNATPITGTWSPAVSTATTGTTVYTFTPTGGQCATTTTLSITVTAPIVPTFNPVASVCQNAAAPVLPTSSTNATPITGTWSPAVSTSTTGTTVYTFTPTGGQCATTTTLSITVTAPIVPTFNPVASVCQNATAPVLPTSSTNATPITGTWSPAVSTSTTGTTVYTFTPTGGQCATTTTLSITVTAPIVPTFNPVASVCQNATAPVLPTSSTNATPITGTWSPAVSTSTTGTTVYTFTPTGGQCATTTTLSITVTAPIVPTFNPVASVCQNAAAPVLPTSSTNATPITGTWSPAVSTATTGTTVYTFTPTGGQCATTTTLSITVTAPIVPTFNPVASVCQNAAAPVLPTSSTNATPITGTWSPAVSTATTGTTVYTFTPTAGQCATTTTLNLTVNANVTSTTNITICTNQLPYSWNGQTYAAGGPHIVTLVSASGCDSIATLNLTVNANVTSTTNITICTNQLPYTWNGQTYAAGGPHIVTLVSSAGCDSIATLNLTVNANVTSTTNITICTNQLPYTWNGQTYAAGGPHIVTLVSSAGCDSIATLNLTVNANVTSTTNITICTNQLPYSWNGQTYAAGGPHIVTLVSSAGCDSIATLNLTVNANVTSTTNITICTNQLPYTWNGQTYAVGGPHTVTLVSASGCDSIATLNLTVNANVTSTTNITICTNQLPYSWNGQTYAAGGPHIVTLVSSAGCDSIATLNLTVNANVTSTTNITICTNQLPYSWNGQTYAVGGPHTVTLVSASGCDSIATLNLTVNANVTSTTNITICTNQLPYTWNGQTYAVGGPHTVTLVSASGCDSIATLNLTVNANVTSTTNITICTNQLPYTWNGQTYAVGGPHTVTLVSASGCDSIATLNLTVNANVTSTTNITICTNQLPYSWNGQTYAAGGPHIVTLVSSAGCDSIATLNLTVNANVTSTTNITICTNQLPYSWNGQTYAVGGPHTVTLVSASGCDSIATLNLTVNANVTSTTNITICTNQLPYTWNGQTYAAGGPHTVTLVSASGCDSIATLNLTVNANVTSTTNITICTNQLPYTWNGQTYAVGGPHTVTLVSASGCDSIATLNLTVNANVTSTTNITICTNQLPYSWNGQTYAAGGPHIVTLVSASGCDSIATLNLTVNANVTSTTNITICTNQLPYTWNGQTYAAGGPHIVTLVSASGCDSIATLNLTVNANVTSTTNITICTNQLPYTWNGQTYAVGGPHTVTLVSASGCDSIATLNLTVNANVTSTTNITICTNQLPYTWNGQTYAAGGPHTVTLVSASGCDSIATLNLTVNANVTSTTNITICTNQLPYSWNGQTYAAGGPHTVTLVSASGCDSIATLNLTVNANVTSTTNITICTNQLPYSWNGQTYAAGGPHIVTLVSASGCDSIATLNLTVNANVTSTTNITICTNQLPYTWNGQTYAAGGPHIVTLVSASGCDSIATLNLTVNANVTSTTNITICTNQLPYTWNGQTYAAGGPHTVTLVSASGCDSIATLNLTVNANVTSTTNITICTNQLPYSWNGQTYAVGGPHTVTLVSASGCDSIATLNLTVNANVTSTTNITICTNQLPYSWNGQTYAAGGPHTVTLVSASGCDSIATLNLTVNANVTSTTNITICTNQLPYTWNGQTYAVGGPHTVTLVSASGCDSIATLNLTVNANVTSTTNITICTNQLPYSWNGQTYAVGGPHTVTLVSASGCDSIATLNLTVNANVTSTTNITICTNQLPYSWNGQTYAAGGPHTVTLVSASGCDSIATLNLTVNANVTSTTNITICTNQLPYSWNGQTYAAGGPHTVTLVSASGCDSIATLNLTVNANVTSTTNITICTNQLPYSWNGQTYAAGGPHIVTLVSSAGCDSIATLNLTVNANVTSTTNITICTNQLPYSWNGQTYAAGGPHIVTLVSSAGCDSIATLNLTVNANVTSTTNITICTNQLPYSWNGQTYAAGGPHIVTLVSSAGCDSIATLNLTVNANVTSTTNITICTNQLPYSWNGQTYAAGGPHIVTLVSSAGCDSIATLNLTVNANVTSTTNITICTNQLPYSWNGQTYAAGGPHIVTLVSSAGCDSIATLNLTVNANVTSTTNITICTNQLPYSWNGQTYAAGGPHIVTLVSSAGCDSIATLNLTVNANVTSTTNITICTNQLPYTWNGQTYAVGGPHTVTLVSASGCDSIATLNLTVNANVTSTTNITICTNQLPYTWNGQTYAAGGPHIVTLVSSAGCDSIATLNLTVNANVTSTTNITICTNQLPYSWNGQTYAAGGPHIVTLVSSAGCDSIATLNLTVNANVTSTTNITICTNQLPYSWNGQTYAVGGPHTVTLVSASGCDSIATLNLTVNPNVTSTTNITICSNHLPYSWNGQNYAAAGTYSVILTSSVGCDSTATLHLTVNSVLTSTTNISVCSNHLPYSWNGQSYAAAGTYAATLTGSNGCDSIASLVLAVKAVSTSTTNASICNNHLPYTWNGQNYAATGSYNITFTGSNGCDSVATLNLFVNPVVTSTTIKSICNNHLPYNWNGQNYSTTGIYSVMLTSIAGCDSIAKLDLTVNPVVNSTTNVTICSSQLPYNWNGQAYSASGIYNITLTSAAGCDSIAKLNLTVNQTPVAPTVASPVVYCQNAASVALTATGTGNILWYGSATGGIGSVTAPVPSTTTGGTYQYYVSQTSAGCESQRALITVKVNSTPKLGADRSIKICFGEAADLTNMYNTAGLITNWLFHQAPVTNPAAVFVGGTYQLIAISNAGCSDTALVNITVQPPVIANAGNDGNAEYNAPYQLNGSGGLTYEWSPASPLNNPHIANPVAILTSDTKFILMVKDDIGCTDYDTVNIRVFKGPTFYVPSAFTPNGDGLNDIFRPTAVGIASLEYFRVFNRYGELVFETSDLTKGWDGTYKGKNQPIDNYVWTIKGVDRKGDLKTMKGNVVLIR